MTSLLHRFSGCAARAWLIGQGRLMRWIELSHEEIALQSGIAGRSQLLSWGATGHDIERWVRQRRLSTALPGVYVTHTGALSWHQQAWVGLLKVRGSALGGASALQWWLRRGTPTTPIELVVSAHATPAVPRGYVVRRLEHFDARVLVDLTPPRQVLEHAALDVAARAQGVAGLFGVLSEVLGSRATTVGRMTDALASRERQSRRKELQLALADLSAGTNSVAERLYLKQVHRPHGLPEMRQQVRRVFDGRVRVHDFESANWGVVIEIDGYDHHSARWDRDQDLRRDLINRAGGLHSLRLGWHQITREPCATAVLIAAVFRAQGWLGEVIACGSQCFAKGAA